MDRDIALQLITKLTAVNTALTTLATNTSPSNVNRSVSDDNMRSAPDPEDLEPLTEDQEPEPEPEPETKK